MKRHFIDRWQEDREKSGPGIVSGLEAMKHLSTEKLDLTSKSFHNQVFEEIDCLECANCCKTTPAILTTSDIKRIARHIDLPPKTFKHRYVLEDLDGELSFKSVPCVFLREDNKCSIYEVRPESCRDYPHTASGAFKKRLQIHRENMDICPAAFEIIRRMQASLKI
jgi:Fe-S-cluster containining protein